MRSTMHWFLLLVLILAVTLAVGACGPAGGGVVATPRPNPTARPTATEKPATPQLVPYQDTGGRFTISYPNGWEISEDDEQIGFFSTDGLLRILVQYTDLGVALDEQGLRTLVDAYFSADGFGGQPDFVRTSDKVQSDGSIRVDYTFTSGGKTARASSFFQTVGTAGYVLSFYALDASLWENALPTFEAVANSFTTQGPSPTPLSGAMLTSQAGAYEILVPSGWQSAEQDGNAFIQKDDETFLSIIMTTTLPSVNPAQAERILIDEKVAAIQYDDPGAQITEPASVPIGGEDGLYVDFVYTDPATSLENTGSVFTVVHHQRAYVFLLFTLASEAAQNNPLFINMITSFRFTD